MLFNKDKMDSVRVVLAVMAAVLSGGGALYGVYVKARSESRTDTAASYETLAPEINELKRAVQALESRTQRGGQGDIAKPRRPLPQRQPDSRPDPDVASTPPQPAPNETPPAPKEPPSDIVDEIKGKIPIDFEKAEQIYRQVRKSRDKTP